VGGIDAGDDDGDIGIKPCCGRDGFNRCAVQAAVLLFSNDNDHRVVGWGGSDVPRLRGRESGAVLRARSIADRTTGPRGRRER
jgi:hypothetical protein